MKPTKQCDHVNCHILIPFDVRYCGQHNYMLRERHRRYDAIREREDKKYRDIYHSTRWRKLRKQILLRDDYLCLHCLEEGKYTQADVVDHITELRDDITKAYDDKNLQSLCHECHNRKTREETEKRDLKSPSEFNPVKNFTE